MKPVVLASAFTATLMAVAPPAGAQDAAPAARLVRSDAHAVVGWQNLRHDSPSDYLGPDNNWLNAILYGGGGTGWYWTDHLKTQVDIGAGTKGSQYHYRQFSVNGSTAYESSRLRIRETNVAVSQQYQFFRNQWFHPHVGAGLDLAHETTREEYADVVVYDATSRTTRLIAPAHTEGPFHRIIARPFGEVGFKAYMSRRAFCVGDTRLRFQHGIDEVRFRIGLGVDF
ncbi:MAG TPA: hypothetical protein VEL79_08620 [Vicinamibacterales bacterium]|nr:hypothetical protein [Vicinamibacterales bacterium]